MVNDINNNYNNIIPNDFEDELYFQRRHVVALGVDELGNDFAPEEQLQLQEELLEQIGNLIEADDIWPEDPHDQMPDLIDIELDMDPFQPPPLERQDAVVIGAELEEGPMDIVQEAADMRREYEAMLNDPNCSWDMIPENQKWTEDDRLKDIDWSFPSDATKEITVRFLQFKLEKEQDLENYPHQPGYPMPVWRPNQQQKNRQRAFYEAFKNCDCCERHKEFFPEWKDDVLLPHWHGTMLEMEPEGRGKSNKCVCPCRHHARQISRNAKREDVE